MHVQKWFRADSQMIYVFHKAGYATQEILWLETNGYSLGPFLGIHILLPSFSSWKDLAYKLGIPAGAASCLAIAPAPGTPKPSAFPFAFSFALLVPIGIYLQLVHSLLLIFF